MRVNKLHENVINPNFEWYSLKSEAKKLPPRCPLASPESCPKYYDCLWLLGECKIIKKLPIEDKICFDKKRELFKSIIGEQESSVNYVDDRLVSINRFCPEISYNVFGYFATVLHCYVDEIDLRYAHQELMRENIDLSDYRWQWWIVIPRHYAECQEYSIFSNFASDKQKKISRARATLSPKIRWEVFSSDSFTCQYCGRKPPEVALEIDHKISVAEGGSDNRENLITACADCNRGKNKESSKR